MRQTVAAVLLAGLLALAGCSTGVDPASGTGTVNFYVSDQPGALEDFEHLNVTVTEVTFVRADGNQTTKQANATFDLTKLEGANASLVEQYELESGDYERVFLSVGEIDGQLESGGSAEVKLPSERLQLNQNFTVGDGGDIDFVYDIMVTKAGGSGMYVIRPVASESGTDVEINEVDARAGASARDGSDGGAETETQGSVAFYLSDEQNAIDDFKHLNVTVSKVGFQRGGESGNWTTYNVDNRTVDLTRLQGANATLLETYDLPAGNYSKVYVSVSEVNGTLTSGESAEVKLPSEKLQLNQPFSVEANATVEFVYDITVVKRGKSGAYNIKPVVGESGTDVPINKIDEQQDDETDGEEAAALNATFVGNVTAGENVTVRVTQNGSAVEGATVEAGGETYTTDANGEVTFAVAEDAEELEVTVKYEDSESELRADLTTTTSTATATETSANRVLALG
ncbi:DUF4382 domain-containing protein [Halosegnis sp.]|uniref:DUF4382 domain-containing protein n=1 Tax=Halosegnis sp. TaxID=2864959 RepID=UPI0035D50E6A